jgi:hypothetical protein
MAYLEALGERNWSATLVEAPFDDNGDRSHDPENLLGQLPLRRRSLRS